MRRSTRALAVILAAAAYGPVVYVTATGDNGGPILPVEAEHVVDAGAATAAKMGIENALAPATSVSSGETATAACQNALND